MTDMDKITFLVPEVAVTGFMTPKCLRIVKTMGFASVVNMMPPARSVMEDIPEKTLAHKVRSVRLEYRRLAIQSTSEFDEDFLQHLIDQRIEADLIILDPPYSPRQVKECYDAIGIKMAQEDAMGGMLKKRRRALIEKLIDKDGVVLSFGWNTNGMGGSEWRIEEILLVAHGSDHNDTICMAERRVVCQSNLF